MVSKIIQFKLEQARFWLEQGINLWDSVVAWDWRLCLAECHVFGAFTRSDMNNKDYWALINTDYSTNCDWQRFLCSLMKTPLKEPSVFGQKSRETETFFLNFLLNSTLFEQQRSATSCVLEEHPPARQGNTSTQNNVHSKRQHTAAHFPDSFPYLSGWEIMEARGSRLASRVAPWLAATQLPRSLANQRPFT